MKKRGAALLLAGAMVLSMIGCGAKGGDVGSSDAGSGSTESGSTESNDGAKGDAKADSDYRFVYLSPNQANPFWLTISEGVQAAVDEKGATLTIFDAQDDAASQVSQAEDAISSGADAILVSPYESDTGTAIVERCNEENIPVFVLDVGAEGNYTGFIAADNAQGGELAAKYIVENTDDSRNVAEIQGVLAREVPARRGKGFNKVMDEESVKVNYCQPANCDRSQGMDIMDTFLTQDKTINAVFCWNDEMALGAKEAIAAHGLSDKVLLVGFDGTDEGVQAVINGELAADIAQKPYQFGTEGVAMAYKYFNGEEFEKDLWIDCELITKENAEEFLTK